ncbi:ceramide glucosyltransferase [Magnaporthiopsis poae ATCC 64411]|uniref:Ceramide glucosyltransferase n=1 Tax=Magnaporthiopsis poae (strain ATCC 64411 / 73-15) TaxID=644358 RepID=A0A0C4DVL8_MAGP6|nr:ceramide glucosyltransferase [Magnaporthiopsis poae ATCC 64411]
MQSLVDGLAYAGAIWSATVFTVQGIGSFQLFRNNSKPPPPPPVSPSLKPQDVPHITIIRPVKGLEPRMYECLASTCQQSYPRDKLSIRLCISGRDDPGYATLERIVADFASADLDIQILLESEDPVLHGAGGDTRNLGPNPKIRNISRAYREAKGDIIWVIDCNIWVSKSAAGRMVDKLLGLAPAGSRGKPPMPYKFVHQLPISIDVTPADEAAATGMMAYGGGRLDEMFMASTHAKFYSAINTWLLAWVGRELLALPIWTWAVLLGTTVTWRGQSFRVRMDMSVVELPGQKGGGGATKAELIPNGSAGKKSRRT